LRNIDLDRGNKEDVMNRFVVGAICVIVAAAGCGPKQTQVAHSSAEVALAPPVEDTAPAAREQAGKTPVAKTPAAEATAPIEAIAARVTDKNIIISGKVMFETDKAVLKAESFPLLNGVVTALVKHPEIVVLSVAGHTDSDGDARYNKKLSLKRAKSVRAYLVKAGIDRNRLRVRGYGPDIPIASNADDEGKYKNRRVEFDIIERGKPNAVTWSTGTADPGVIKGRDATDSETEAAVKRAGQDL
jgi:outer membrane protein OmpA-like peptidoglycan-associated protein